MSSAGRGARRWRWCNYTTHVVLSVQTRTIRVSTRQSLGGGITKAWIAGRGVSVCRRFAERPRRGDGSGFRRGTSDVLDASHSVRGEGVSRSKAEVDGLIRRVVACIVVEVLSSLVPCAVVWRAE